jgi:hypothetical protein
VRARRAAQVRDERQRILIELDASAFSVKGSRRAGAVRVSGSDKGLAAVADGDAGPMAKARAEWLRSYSSIAMASRIIRLARMPQRQRPLTLR